MSIPPKSLAFLRSRHLRREHIGGQERPWRVCFPSARKAARAPSLPGACGLRAPSRARTLHACPSARGKQQSGAQGAPRPMPWGTLRGTGLPWGAAPYPAGAPTAPRAAPARTSPAGTTPPPRRARRAATPQRSLDTPRSVDPTWGGVGASHMAPEAPPASRKTSRTITMHPCPTQRRQAWWRCTE